MNRTQLMLGGLLLVQLVLILIFHSPFSDATTTQPRPLIPELAALTPRQLEIQGPDDPRLMLVKRGEEWQVDDLGGFPADSQKVETMIEELEMLEVRRPVVSSGRYHSAFKVDGDENEARIRLWEDASGDPVVDLIVGSAPNFRSSHVRRADEDNVYEVRGLSVLRQQRVAEAIAVLEERPEMAPAPEAPCYDDAVGDLEPRPEQLPADPEEYEPESETLVAIMGGSIRKGEWEPPEILYVFALMGGAELDFSDAILLEGVSEVRIFALMGGVNIKVPTDINVQVRGTGIMGGFTEFNQRIDDPDAPTLRVKGWAVMGGVEVKLKKEKKKWLGKR